VKRLALIFILLCASSAWAHTVVASVALTPGASSSTVTYTATAGNMLIIVLGTTSFNNWVNDYEITDSQGNTWIEAGGTNTRNDATSEDAAKFFYLPNAPGGSDTVTVVTLSAGGSPGSAGALMEVSGFSYNHYPKPVCAFAGNGGCQTGGTPDGMNPTSTGSITTTASTFQVIMGYAAYANSPGLCTASVSGFTLANDVFNGNPRGEMSLLYKDGVSAGTYNYSVSICGTGHVGVVAFADETYPTAGYIQTASVQRYSSGGSSAALATSPRFNLQTGGHVEYVSINETGSSATAPTSVVSTLGNTCSVAFTYLPGLTNEYEAVYACPVTTGGAETITVTPSTSLSVLTINVLEYIASSTVNASGNSGSSSGSNPVLASVTSTAANSLIFGIFWADDSTLWPLAICSSGLTPRAYYSGQGGVVSIYDETEASTGTYSNSCSGLQGGSASSNMVNAMLAWSPASPVGSTQIGVFLVGP
jgi:hypothetical protein